LSCTRIAIFFIYDNSDIRSFGLRYFDVVSREIFNLYVSCIGIIC